MRLNKGKEKIKALTLVGLESCDTRSRLNTLKEFLIVTALKNLYVCPKSGAPDSEVRIWIINRSLGGS